jgi:tetratricopeptide (TPR) repeat protein
LNLSGLVRAREAVRVGQLVRADWFLLGGLSASPQGNAIVARIVDAHSGIMRDITLIKADADTPRLARGLADFVSQTRQAATATKPRVFLAIGAFADLSVNNRQADLPARLRADLTAAYQGSGLTLLEREHVNTLLQEVNLDLAGLTGEGATNQTMQSAMWLVDGYYQSMETVDQQVELVLRVNRIFGRPDKFTLRAPAGAELVRRIKESIDTTINKQGPYVTIPTRISEIRAQMNTGKELARLHVIGPSATHMLLLMAYDSEPWAQYGNKESVEGRNLEEAIRAFETVLLLDPENHEARMYAAACMRAGIIGRMEDARSYYREIIAFPVQNQWTTQAMRALGWSYRPTDPLEAAKWFREAGDTLMERNSLDDALRKEGATERTIGTLEERLIGSIRSGESALKGKGGGLSDDMGMQDFARAFGTNRMEAANRINALMPRLKETFPDIVPHLLAASVSFQADTNAAVIAEFRSSLKQCAEATQSITNSHTYFNHLLRGTYEWCMENRQYALAVEIGEAAQRVATEGYAKFEREEKVKLALAYRALERWQEALSLFESLGNQPMELLFSRLWGRPFLPSQAAAECRAKLGLPPAQDLSQFELGPPALRLRSPSAFVVDGSALWVALPGKLLRLDLELKTNSVIALPDEGYAPANTMCVGPEHIWIGTAGSGLIEYNKATGQISRFTEKDGLTMDEIESLHLRDKSLWIGYGQWDIHTPEYYASRRGGGLGWFDLQSRRFGSLIPSISGQGLITPKSLGMQKGAGDVPPQTPVIGIVAGRAGELCTLSTGSGLQAHLIADKTWTPLSSGWNPTSLTTDSNQLFVGHKDGGVYIVSLKDNQTRTLNVPEGLPAPQVSALALDGSDLWIGGNGFVAVADIQQNKVRKVSYVSTRSVDRIQVASGYAWVQFGGRLYRTSLQAVR